MIAILGAGIAGIAAGYHLSQRGIEHTIFEKNTSWGGLCDNFSIGEEFLFDKFVHLSFTKSEVVKELFHKNTAFYSHKPESSNYYNNLWLKHPVQNNLAPLPVEEKVKIIEDFVAKPSFNNIQNYEEWLLVQFGTYFKEHFSEKYTRKYWSIPSKELTTDWLANRISIPSLETLLKGAFEVQEENFYYAQEMRYPQQGGYKSFLNNMATNVSIKTQKEVALIDPLCKKITFVDGCETHYEKLISSLPLPEIVKIIKDAPKSILEAGEKLLATSGQLVSIGFNRPDVPKYLWFYIYDEDILPARAYSPSLKSPYNVPKGKSSLQFETYFSKKKPKQLSGDGLVNHIIEKGIQMKLWEINDIAITDYREEKYANVVFDFNRKSNVVLILNYLKSVGIISIGRFGEWDYFWSDQSLLSGFKGANTIENR
ncbi:protoporphyrinogen/coproporphyrinogen oxidase [Capnocytophaga sputigena]|uniref:protoporphyrinogen/coproporphyrinogen oxidase n=1 Tax=Capnocytophaga sputigena TaxID=1019 RepID=UPI0028D39E56|nr:NAD(P)-binding protein [Capnocytophaga sputigena]